MNNVRWIGEVAARWAQACVLACAALLGAAGPALAADPAQGPGGPILVVTSGNTNAPTVMLNVALPVKLPSLAVRVTPLNVPASPVIVCQVRTPVFTSTLDEPGSEPPLQVITSPSGSVALGVTVMRSPSTAVTLEIGATTGGPLTLVTTIGRTRS